MQSISFSATIYDASEWPSWARGQPNWTDFICAERDEVQRNTPLNSLRCADATVHPVGYRSEMYVCLHACAWRERAFPLIAVARGICRCKKVLRRRRYVKAHKTSQITGSKTAPTRVTLGLLSKPMRAQRQKKKKVGKNLGTAHQQNSARCSSAPS